MPVPDFSVGEVFTAAAADSIGMWLVKSQTVGSAQSTIQVTNCFTDDYDVYRITYTGGTCSARTAMGMYMGTTTATAYYGGRVLVRFDGTTAFAGDNNTGQWNYAGYVTTNDAFVDITLANPKLTRNTKIHATLFDGAEYFGTYTGMLDNSTSYTGFTLDPGGAATVTGGTVRVYGIRD